jgi:hypothetical protein
MGHGCLGLPLKLAPEPPLLRLAVDPVQLQPWRPRPCLSVSDKQGLVPLAQGLLAAGYRLLSSGGTAAALQAAGRHR